MPFGPKVKHLSTALATAQKRLEDVSHKLSSSEEKTKKWYKELRSERQTRKRLETKKASLEDKLNSLYDANDRIIQENAKLASDTEFSVE